MSKNKKVLVWDLEFLASRNYRGDLRIYPGYIICFSCKELDKNETLTFSMLTHPGKNPTDDRNLVRAIGAILQDSYMSVLHYGKKCDWKFIQTKLLQYGFPTLPESPTIVDTCQVAQEKLGLKSNSLATIAQFLGFDEQKMPITESQWHLAFAGHKPTLKEIEKRCASDVRLTEKVYKKLLPLIGEHPRAPTQLASKFPENCCWCGSKQIWSCGYRGTAQGVRERFRCNGCGRGGSVTTKEVTND